MSLHFKYLYFDYLCLKHKYLLGVLLSMFRGGVSQFTKVLQNILLHLIFPFQLSLFESWIICSTVVTLFREGVPLFHITKVLQIYIDALNIFTFQLSLFESWKISSAVATLIWEGVPLFQFTAVLQNHIVAFHIYSTFQPALFENWTFFFAVATLIRQRRNHHFSLLQFYKIIYISTILVWILKNISFAVVTLITGDVTIISIY